MDKKNQHRRSKRQNKITEDNFWDCSVCTYRNTAEAFKCLMCDVRKGTSTRKPRINPQLVAQQVAQQYTQSLPKVKKESAPGSVASSSTPTTTPVSTPTLPISTPTVHTASSSNNMSTVTVTTTAPATITTPATSTVTSTTTTTNNNSSSSTPTVSTKVEPSPPPPPPSVVAVPVIPPAVAIPGNKSEKIRSPSVDGKSTSSRRLRPKLKNVDRSRAECQAVTVNNVTVIITEFQPKRHYSSLSDHGGHQPSSGPTAPGFNHSNGSRNGGGVGGGGGGNAGDLGTFQMEGSPAENGLHPDLSHKHQRLAL